MKEARRLPDGRREYALVLPLPASWNALYRTGQHGRPVMTAAGQLYEKGVRGYIEHWMEREGLSPLAGRITARIRIVWPNDSRQRDPHNIDKLLFDTLKGLLFADDSLVYPQHTPPAQVDPTQPRVEVTLTENRDAGAPVPDLDPFLAELQVKILLKHDEAVIRKRKRKRAAAEAKALAKEEAKSDGSAQSKKEG